MLLFGIRRDSSRDVPVRLRRRANRRLLLLVTSRRRPLHLLLPHLLSRPPPPPPALPLPPPTTPPGTSARSRRRCYSVSLSLSLSLSSSPSLLSLFPSFLLSPSRILRAWHRQQRRRRRRRCTHFSPEGSLLYRLAVLSQTRQRRWTEEKAEDEAESREAEGKEIRAFILIEDDVSVRTKDAFRRRVSTAARARKLHWPIISSAPISLHLFPPHSDL